MQDFQAAYDQAQREFEQARDGDTTSSTENHKRDKSWTNSTISIITDDEFEKWMER